MLPVVLEKVRNESTLRHAGSEIKMHPALWNVGEVSMNKSPA